MTRHSEPKTRFTLTIERVRDANTIHALRALLKALLRRHGFRCIDAREVGVARRHTEIARGVV